MSDEALVSFGDWQDPKALRSRKEAKREIAAGALNEGRKCGISGRSATYHSGAREESPSATDFEVALVKPSPDLGLLLFLDTPRESSWVSTPRRSREKSWASAQPRSFVDWVYRNNNGHPRPIETTSAATSRCTSSCRPLGPISEASASQCKNGRTASASSTRAPSRATQASPEASSRAPSRATQVSPEVGFSRGPSRASQASPEVVLRTPSPGNYSRSPSPSAPRSPTPSAEARSGVAVPSGWATSVEFDPIVVLPVSAQLDAAARAAGERVRGSVAIAMRAQTICRSAATAASRRLLHLYVDPTYPPPSSSSFPDQAGSSPGSSPRERRDKFERKRSEPRFQAILDHKDSIPPHHVPQLHSQDWICKKKRVIRVARNTPLGRMVRSDPERAKKYDMIAVPSWTRNKPWPPPPVKFKKTMAVVTNEDDEESGEDMSDRKASFRKRMQRTRTSFKETEEEIGSPRSPLASMKRVTQMISQASTISRNGTATTLASRPHLPSDVSEGGSSRCRAGTVDSLGSNASAERTAKAPGPADLERATTLFGRDETASLTKLFYQCAQPGRHVLNRHGMIKALREAGYTPDTKDEQKCFAAVQEQVLEHKRGNDNDPLTNPILNAQGHWELCEFILMLQALQEIGARQTRLNNKQIADEFCMTMTEVEELRFVFDGYDPEASGNISRSELKALVQEAELATAMMEEDFTMLLESVNFEDVEKFDFRQLLKIVVQLSRLLNTQALSPKFAAASPVQTGRNASTAWAGTHKAISGWVKGARESTVSRGQRRRSSQDSVKPLGDMIRNLGKNTE